MHMRLAIEVGNKGIFEKKRKNSLDVDGLAVSWFSPQEILPKIWHSTETVTTAEKKQNCFTLKI